MNTAPADPASLLARLADIVGPAHVLTGDDVRSRAVGWADHGPCQALAIVRPASTGEVSQVLATCHDAGQPVVPFGGLTGLVRGAVAAAHEIALSLERMQRIEAVDPVGRTMTVQAGVPLQRIQEAAEQHGLLYPVDFGARGSAHIGGSVATNAGGNGVIRYGMTRDSVLGLEAVLADGTVIPAHQPHAEEQRRLRREAVLHRHRRHARRRHAPRAAAARAAAQQPGGAGRLPRVRRRHRAS